MPDLPNPNPILATPLETGPRQEQVVADFLCLECEDRFNQHGEKWVLENGYRLNAPSKLHAMLSGASPLPNHAGGTVHAGAEIPGLDTRRLAYFGASVFWRASATAWQHTGRNVPLIDLGPYRERLRRYLLGDGEFPDDVVLWVAVCRAPLPPPVMSFPSGGRNREGIHFYTFDIPGLSFALHVGKQIPMRSRELCTVRSPQKIVFFTPVEEIIARNAAQLFAKSPPSRALRKLHRRLWNEELG
jgi:hypothetical protein